MLKGGVKNVPKSVDDVLFKANKSTDKKKICVLCDERIDKAVDKVENSLLAYKAPCCHHLFHFCCSYVDLKNGQSSCANCGKDYTFALAEPNRGARRRAHRMVAPAVNLEHTVKLSEDYPEEFLYQQTLEVVLNGLYDIIRKKDPYGKEPDMKCIQENIRRDESVRLTSLIDPNYETSPRRGLNLSDLAPPSAPSIEERPLQPFFDEGAPTNIGFGSLEASPISSASSSRHSVSSRRSSRSRSSSRGSTRRRRRSGRRHVREPTVPL